MKAKIPNFNIQGPGLKQPVQINQMPTNMNIQSSETEGMGCPVAQFVFTLLPPTSRDYSATRRLVRAHTAALRGRCQARPVTKILQCDYCILPQGFYSSLV